MLTVFHDITDPVSAVVVPRYTRAAQDGVAISFEGFDPLGVDMALPITLDMLALFERMQELAAAEGVPLRRPASRPPTGLAHVLLHAAESGPRAHAVRLGLYTAYWSMGADIADPGVLVGIAERAGCDTSAAADLLSDRLALASRRREMNAHRRVGVGGVPVVLASRTLIGALMSESAIRELAAGV